MKFSAKLSTILVAATAISAVGLTGLSVQAETIKIGASAPKTGPLAGGSTVTYWPNVKLWVEQVNARGGLQLKSGKAKIELIEYDDRTNPGEAIKNIQRLATQDKVDFILAPYGTGFNLATAPIFNKHGYPLITHTAITDKIEALTKRYDNIFFTLGSTTTFSVSVVNILKKMRAEGVIGNKIAMVNVADAFGIEMANAARPVFKQEGFEIVYDKSYPLGTPDLSPIIKGAKDSNPDAFVAWSYPPDTFGLTEQAIIQDLDVKMYYTAVATCFPAFKGKFGSKVEGVFGAGGVNQDSARIQEYFKAHQEITGKAADGWASANTYVSLEILGQAIEGAGTLDRKVVTQYIKDNTFDTIMGPISFEGQISNKFWTVGQWQDGKFRGVKSSQMDGAAPIVVKDGWN
jgi:branched-chain amino acid transport system substrate-binding protein